MTIWTTTNPAEATLAEISTHVQYCTGFGQFDTHAETLSSGEKNKSPKGGTDYTGITGKEIVAMVRNPRSCPKKEAQWFIPSTYRASDGRDFGVQRDKGEFWFLPLDEDGNTHNNLSLDDIDGALKAVCGDVARLIYSTRGSTKEKRKWRGLVPLAKSLSGSDYEDTVAAFNALLIEASEGVLIPDPALERPAQLIFLPNRGKHYEHAAHGNDRLSLAPDHPIIVKREAIRAERASAEAEFSKRREARQRTALADPDGSTSKVWEAFNNNTTVAAELAHYGYQQSRNRKDWKSPNSSSGSYAVRNYGDFWISYSGSDAEAGIGNKTSKGACIGDAFDLYVHYDHGGDRKAAIRTYAKEIGMDHETRRAQELAKSLSVIKTKAEPKNTDDGNDWHSELVVNSGGHVVWNVSNAAQVLSHHPDWKGVFALNEFTQRRMVLRSIPGTRKGNRELTDADTTRVVRWFNKNGFPMASANVTVQVIHLTCADNAYDPLADYLNGLEWDGQERLSGWLTRYIGAAPSDYVSEVGKRWLISAAARGLNPGVKADHMLVFEGSQGKLKSTALATLAGTDWFGDNLPPMGSKDAQEYLPGHWIIEAAELEAMRREVDQIKAFISRQTDRFRPAYGREIVTQPRRCVFAGSTNKDDWQRDPTGGRRFWPVKVGIVDIEALKADRDQLWAEAVARYRKGQRWWLKGGIEEVARQEVSARTASDDPWTADVLNYVEPMSEIAIVQILMHLGFDPTSRTRKDSNRVADILKEAGWQRGGKFTSGGFKDQARYIPPE